MRNWMMGSWSGPPGVEGESFIHMRRQTNWETSVLERPLLKAGTPCGQIHAMMHENFLAA